MRSLLAVIAAGVLAAPLAAGTAGAEGGALPRICAEELRHAELMNPDLTLYPKNGVVILGNRYFPLRNSPAVWRMWDSKDPVFSTRFHSMMWLVPGLLSGLPAVNLVLQREAASPDPGYASGDVALRKSGWTSGALRLRMGTVACLYSATRDERLVPVMEGLVAANLDPHRYRGAPLSKVHNHATLANFALLEAASVFGRPEWRDSAIDRFVRDAGDVFHPCGMSTEQSSTYHLLNLNLWRRALDRLGAETDVGIDMGDRLHRAAVATWQLTRPDGVLDAIGVGHPAPVTAAQLGLSEDVVYPTRLMCPHLGWAANRTSWDDSATHYVLRFGPPRAAHGHVDRGSVTWFTQGVAVFADRGMFDRTRDRRWRWAHSPEAHSTFGARDMEWPGYFQVRADRGRGVDRYVVNTVRKEARMSREFVFSLGSAPAGATMAVVDSGSSTRAREWTQRWQLDEGWRPARNPARDGYAARHSASGLYLLGTCRSGRGQAVEVPMRVRAVETYPAWRTVAPAYALECRATGRDVRLRTQWKVTASPAAR